MSNENVNAIKYLKETLKYTTIERSNCSVEKWENTNKIGVWKGYKMIAECIYKGEPTICKHCHSICTEENEIVNNNKKEILIGLTEVRNYFKELSGGKGSIEIKNAIQYIKSI